jgi:hypothetical protein
MDEGVKLAGTKDLPMQRALRQPIQKRLKNCWDKIKVDGLGVCAGNGEIVVMNDVNRKEETIQDDSPMKYDTQFKFIKDMLSDGEVSSNKQIKGGRTMWGYKFSVRAQDGIKA